MAILPARDGYRHAPDGGGRKRQLVLAVEDEHHDWTIYGKLLWYNGFDVIHAETAEEALGLALEHRPDVVLTDVMLPGMDGIELCSTLKADDRTRNIPLVVLTARRKKDLGARASRAGCDRFLEKPIGPVDVLHVIEDIVGRAPPPVE